MNTKQIDEFLLKALYDQTETPPENQVVCRIKFKTIGSLGDFILFSGRPKSGKTKFLSGFISAAISKENIFDFQIRLPEDKKEVIHFDTEQSRYSHYKMMELIKQLLANEKLPDHFKSFRCRSLSGSNLLAVIEHYLKINPKVGIICLDGLLDTIESMNDTKNSSYLKGWLKRITEQYNILLAGVIHRGFANDKSIGHIGSDGERAAQSVLMVEKNKELRQYILKAEFLRDDDEFDPVAIFYNTQLSLWQLTDFINDPDEKPHGLRKRTASEYDIQEHQDNVRRIFVTQDVQSYQLLVENIKQQYAIGTNAAKLFLNYLKDDVGLIFKTKTGYTNIRQARLYIQK